MLALREFGEQALEVRDRLRRLIGPRERLGQIEIDAVAAAEAGVIPEDLPEPVEREVVTA